MFQFLEVWFGLVNLCAISGCTADFHCKSYLGHMNSQTKSHEKVFPKSR